MESMLLMVNRNGASAGEPAGMTEMEKFAAKLAADGQLRGGAALQPETSGARIRVRDGKAVVAEGPFADTEEVVGGWLIVEAEDRSAAIEIAKRCPHARGGIVEVRNLPDRDAARSGQGTKFMFLLMMAPDLTDPEGAKYREMVGYDEALKREGPYLESSQLALDPPAARVETRGGRTVVTDGPFAETKEVAGGYYLVEAASRAQAIDLAKRCPHAKWGTVEVREIVNVPKI